VTAVACDEMIAAAAGAKGADELAALVPAAAWQRLSCTDGSKGPRLYDWALMSTGHAGDAATRPLPAAATTPAEQEISFCCRVLDRTWLSHTGAGYPPAAAHSRL
jgi:hypothetical protein